MTGSTPLFLAYLCPCCGGIETKELEWGSKRSDELLKMVEHLPHSLAVNEDEARKWLLDSMPGYEKPSEEEMIVNYLLYSLTRR